MARLFVANCTRQQKEVYFRLDFNAEGNSEPNARFQPAKRQMIPPGRQINLGGDLHIKQIEDIVDQLKKYGLVGVVDVPRLRRAAPYVFDVDKQVSVNTIRQVMQVNAGLQIEEGKQRRAKAAIVVNETVSNIVQNEFAEAGIPKDPKQDVEVEFEQLEQSEAGESTIGEGFKIDASAPAGGPPKGKGGGKGGKARGNK